MADVTYLATDLIPFAAVNAAKQIAWQHCSDAVSYVASVMADDEVDTETRVWAADILLTFALKGPS